MSDAHVDSMLMRHFGRGTLCSIYLVWYPTSEWDDALNYWITDALWQLDMIGEW